MVQTRLATLFYTNGGVIAAVASCRPHTPGIDVAGRRMEKAELGFAGGSLPRLRNARLVLALWIAADETLCCEGLSIKRRGWHVCGYQHACCCADRSSSPSGGNVDGPCCESPRAGRHICDWCTSAKEEAIELGAAAVVWAADVFCPFGWTTLALQLCTSSPFHAAGLHTVSCIISQTWCAAAAVRFQYRYSFCCFTRGDNLGVSY